MAAIYDGLTRNIWTGTWSPEGDHPIVLSNELRGGIHYVSGTPNDRLLDIPGQRLQEGMLVYVKSAYDNITADTFYQYVLLPGESRDVSTGAVPNEEANWSRATLSISVDYLSQIGDVSNITAVDNQILTWDSATNEWTPKSEFVGDVVSATGFTLIDYNNETFTGNVFGSVFADDSTILVDADSAIFNGTLYGSVFANDSTLLVDAENGSISWHVLSDVPRLVEKTSDTGSALMPTGSSAERDATPGIGYVRFNTSKTVFEGYNGHSWVPFSGDSEYILEFQNTGTYQIDIFSGDIFQSAEYKIQAKAAEGVQFSTFAVVFGGDAASTVHTEYGVIQTQNINIADYYAETDANNNITIFCDVLYPNTKIVFKKQSLTNI